MYKKKYGYKTLRFFLIIINILLSAFVYRTFGKEDYSGACVYPGGIYELDLPAGYSVLTEVQYGTIEIYKENGPNSEPTSPSLAGRYLYSELKYMKIKSINGPYIVLNFDVYDKSNKHTFSIKSGPICNLNWFREHHGKYTRSFPEKEPELPQQVELPRKENENVREALFCLMCFAVGGVMGFKLPKMLKY